MNHGPTLREYQEEAVGGTLRAWTTRRRVLGVAPTGAGKTVILAELLRRRSESGPALVIAHREELLTQCAEKLESVGMRPEIERAQRKAGFHAPVVVASVQTLSRLNRLRRWPPWHFKTVVVDEAHHAPAEGYRRVLEHFNDASVLGVTATPFRSGGGEIGDVFESVAFEIQFPDLVRDGFLSKVTVETVPLRIDLSGVHRSAGDFVAGEVADRIEPYMGAAVEEVTKRAAGRRVLVFLPLRRTSERFAEIAREHGWNAAHVDGDSTDRAETLRRFRSGGVNMLCNASLLTEGFDCPEVDCVVPMRPTRSRSLYVQMVGRGTRIAPGKRDCLLIDFLWQSERLTVSRPACLVSAEDVPNVRDGEIVQAVSEARERQKVDREKALAKELALAQKRSSDLVDPEAWGEWCGAANVARFRPFSPWHHHPPSPRQLDAIAGGGLDAGAVRNKGHAAAIIDLMFARRKARLATPRQMRALVRKFGRVDARLTADEAKEHLKLADGGAPAEGAASGVAPSLEARALELGGGANAPEEPAGGGENQDAAPGFTAPTWGSPATAAPALVSLPGISPPGFHRTEFSPNRIHQHHP